VDITKLYPGKRQACQLYHYTVHALMESCVVDATVLGS
jgi:hypothetical protein